MHLTVYYPHAEPTVTLQRWPACCLVRPAPRRDPYPACIARGAARTYKVESEGGTGLRPARRNPPASWPRLAEAGGRPALALMALAGRIEAGGRGGRSLWAAGSAHGCTLCSCSPRQTPRPRQRTRCCAAPRHTHAPTRQRHCSSIAAAPGLGAAVV